MSRSTRHVLAALLSGGIALAVLWPFFPERRAPSATVELIDTTAARAELNARRSLLPAATSDPLNRLPLTLESARAFYPSIGKGHVFDPRMYSVRVPSVTRTMFLTEYDEDGKYLTRTNARGMRDEEVRAEQPDVRVIVVGDSHVDGVCQNEETYPNLLEVLLAERHPGRSIEVLNAAQGGWDLWNYLGALETLLELRPDAFVVTLYGGNDFACALPLHHYFRGDAQKIEAQRVSAVQMEVAKVHGGIQPQYYSQVLYFARAPEEEAVAAELASAVTDELARLCRDAGVALLGVYLPPLAEVQPELYARHLQLVRTALPVPPEAEQVSVRLADGWLAHLEQAGVARVDLRPAFRASTTPLYWLEDHHINLKGQALVASTVLPVLEQALGLR